MNEKRGNTNVPPHRRRAPLSRVQKDFQHSRAFQGQSQLPIPCVPPPRESRIQPEYGPGWPPGRPLDRGIPGVRRFRATRHQILALCLDNLVHAVFRIEPRKSSTGLRLILVRDGGDNFLAAIKTLILRDSPPKFIYPVNYV